MKRFLANIIKNNRGVAYMEFALSLPFMLLLFGGAIDVTRMVLLHQKLDKAVFTVGDLATQLQQNNACSSIRNWEDTVVKDMLLPFPFRSSGYWFMVTAVIGNNAGTRDLMEWRYNLQYNSRSVLGSFTGPYNNNVRSSLPAGIRGLQANERIIVTEMGYNFRPLFPLLSRVGAHDFRKASYFRSRTTTGTESMNSGYLSACS